MAMDFFGQQDRARRQTLQLLGMFVFSVAVIITAIYLVILFATGAFSPDGRGGPGPGVAALWNPGLLLTVAGGTILVICLGSFYKIAELAAGGPAVAAMMGGRLVDRDTRNLAEKRLLNVVDEMSLAAGIPAPPCYVLDEEPSINAFAAGHRPDNAVVAVSRGSLEYLTRDELQGVLGHEFSHILNGDMRLNLRLIGIVYGILVLSIIGYYIMRAAGFMESSRSSDSDSDSDRKGDNRMPIFLIGLAIFILGYLGVFLGKVIQSAISRQREFLADASSAQFTRNPAGLAGALKKIGGLSEGSRIRNAHAQEVSHMFFGDAFAGSLFNLFATHPPLEERIRLLEPNFDGQFPEVEPLQEVGE
jgi:Zn-dependent protease with chaperone function